MASGNLVAFKTFFSSRLLSCTVSSKLSQFSNLRLCSSSAVTSNNKNDSLVQDLDGRPSSDPVASAFFKPSVQMCLGRLTGLDYSRVFRVARRGQEIKSPTYVFMTDEELAESQKNADKRAKQKWLQMPPVMSPRSQTHRVLDQDVAIQGFDIAKYVFTDITYGVHDRSRFIVVREPDGSLRDADGEERDRLNQIYFPKEGRKIHIPLLFKDPEALVEVLNKGGDRYLYVLDRNCVQFEPDHPLYIRTAETAYNTIDEKRDYELLKSTRYYGPMLFHLVWSKNCDNYLIHQLKHSNISAAFDTVLLYSMLHPDSKVATLNTDSSSSSSSSDEEEGSSFEQKLKMLRLYITNDSSQETKLTAVLESMIEQKKNQISADRGISEAHGTQKSN